MPVSTTHTQYARMMPQWRKMRDTTACEDVIHDSGELYLPKLDKMTKEQYIAYVKRASFPLYTKHTLSNFVGMTMRKDVMTTEVPDELIDNVDGKGSSLIRFVKNLVQEYLTYGRAGTLVEWSNDRPILLMYDAENILNWRTKVVDEVEVLGLVVLQEFLQNTDDLYAEQITYQYRVLLLDDDDTYIQEVYNQAGDLIEIVQPERNFKPLDRIPFIIHGGWDVEYPPLLAIAETNLAYYRLDADYKHGLHYTALPTPYTIGIEDPKGRPSTLGSSEIWHLPDGAQCGMLEFGGEGLGQVATAKKELHDQIVTLSSRILAPPMNLNETATAAAIRNAGDTASLAEIVGMLSRELTDIMRLAISWETDNDEDTLEVAINTDFVPTVLSGSDVASYVAAYLKGGMSFHTLFEVLKQGEIQEGNRNIEDEIFDIEKEQKERQALEVDTAAKLAKVEAPKEPFGGNQSGYMPQEPDGEQVNKGQLDEN